MQEVKRRIEHAAHTGATDLWISCLKLTSLPENIFAPLIGLQTLSIFNIEQSSLPENIFAPLTSLRILNISNNQLTSLPKNIFAPLTALQTLIISSNRLTSLPEKIFAPLTGLRILNISNIQLTSLPEKIFAPLTDLQILNIHNNKLTSLPEKIFAPLTDLQILDIHNNKLTRLPENIFAPLTSLQTLNIYGNQLTSLPTSILDCRRLTTFLHYNNELTPDIRFQRFIERMENYNNHRIFTDGQNVHSSSIQTSTKQSINTLFKDPFDCSKDDIIKECITWPIQCLPDLLTYLDDIDVHSTLLVSFYDVFVKVFGRIMSHPNKTDIICRLDEELKESECKCFTGRLTRLINSLVGFYDDIVIGISDSERISAIILSTLDDREMTDEMKKICVDKLKAIDIADEEIEKWLA
jgi:Leucine-rich repeat (LRR) protein